MLAKALVIQIVEYILGLFLTKSHSILRADYGTQIRSLFYKIILCKGTQTVSTKVQSSYSLKEEHCRNLSENMGDHAKVIIIHLLLQLYL